MLVIHYLNSNKLVITDDVSFYQSILFGILYTMQREGYISHHDWDAKHGGTVTVTPLVYPNLVYEQLDKHLSDNNIPHRLTQLLPYPQHCRKATDLQHEILRPAIAWAILPLRSHNTLVVDGVSLIPTFLKKPIPFDEYLKVKGMQDWFVLPVSSRPYRLIQGRSLYRYKRSLPNIHIQSYQYQPLPELSDFVKEFATDCPDLILANLPDSPVTNSDVTYKAVWLW